VWEREPEKASSFTSWNIVWDGQVAFNNGDTVISLKLAGPRQTVGFDNSPSVSTLAILNCAMPPAPGHTTARAHESRSNL